MKEEPHSEQVAQHIKFLTVSWLGFVRNVSLTQNTISLYRRISRVLLYNTVTLSKHNGLSSPLYTALKCQRAIGGYHVQVFVKRVQGQNVSVAVRMR